MNFVCRVSHAIPLGTEFGRAFYPYRRSCCQTFLPLASSYFEGAGFEKSSLNPSILRTLQSSSLLIPFPDQGRGTFSDPSAVGLQRTNISEVRRAAGDEPIAAPFSTVLRCNIISDIIGAIFRLPRILWGLLRKEESIVANVEEDVDKAAEVVKGAAKMIEEVAEGVEKVSKVVEEDAEKVEGFMDKVKETAKEVHKDIDEAMEALEGMGGEPKRKEEKSSNGYECRVRSRGPDEGNGAA